jgi:hypothetical protein
VEAFIPPSRGYNICEHDMFFYMTFTLHETRVERCIHHVKEKYLDDAPIKCVVLAVSTPSRSQVARRIYIAYGPARTQPCDVSNKR